MGENAPKYRGDFGDEDGARPALAMEARFEICDRSGLLLLRDFDRAKSESGEFVIVVKSVAESDGFVGKAGTEADDTAPSSDAIRLKSIFIFHSFNLDRCCRCEARWRGVTISSSTVSADCG